MQKLSPEQAADQLRLRVQTLLADRFQLKVTRAARERQVYALRIAKIGLKMQSAETLSGGSVGSVGSSTTMGAGRFSCRAVSVASLAAMLSDELGRPEEDHTGLTGKFTFSLRRTPDLDQEGASPAGPRDSTGPSLVTAIQEQLGLKLDVTKGRIEIVVVEHIERPTEN